MFARAPVLPLALLALLAALAGWRALMPMPLPDQAPRLAVLRAPPGVAVAWHAAPPAGAAVPVRITGRAMAEGGGWRFGWAGFQAEAEIAGDSLHVALDDPLNRWRITVGAAEAVLTRPGQGTLAVTGLGPGPHRLRAAVLSEPAGPARLIGVHAPGGGALPQPPAWLIEFVGDSDTVGYGNGSPVRDCTDAQLFLATDVTQSFGPQAAARLGVGWRMVARSGIGIVRNYGGGPAPGLPALYPRALPDGPDAAADPPADAVVIALGSNDIAVPLAAGEPWADPAALHSAMAEGLADFALAIRAAQPEAFVLMLAFGEYGAPVTDAARAAAAAVSAAGGRADVLVLPRLSRRGCHWHPSARDHRRIADLLVARLSQPDVRGAP